MKIKDLPKVDRSREKLEQATVVIDESGRELFKYQLAKYLKNKVNFKNKNCLKKVKMQDSRSNNLLQLADMIAGAVNRSLGEHKDEQSFRAMVRAREIYVQIWPK